MSLPNVGQAAVNDDGHFTVPWRKWLAGVERTIAAGGINTTALAADIAAIATALGSPDGTVTNIPDQDALNVRFDGQNGIQIEGAVAGGRVSVIWRGGVSNLSDVDLTGLADTYALKWDAASSTWKPGAAGGVTDGDKGDVIVSGSGSVWTLESNLKKGAIGCTFDGGGNVLTVNTFCDVVVPYNCTITKATLLADQAGSLVVGVWKDVYANFPPTAADNIAASGPPTLSSALKSQDSTLTGWTTTLTAGDVVRFNVNSVATITRAELTLEVTKL